ncbi:hypothetical protein K443DRAFT_105092, partial [Laccaria amethystina LaAM-08-1]
ICQGAGGNLERWKGPVGPDSWARTARELMDGNSTTVGTPTSVSPQQVEEPILAGRSSSQLKLDPSRSSGKSSPLAVAPPTSQRHRGSTPPHMVVRRTSDRDARVFVSHQTSLTQDVMLPASQHAQSSYPVSPSAPSKRSSTITLAPPAIQHSQHQNASQLTGDLAKSPTVRIPVPRGSSFGGDVTTDANHPCLAHQHDMAPHTHRETITIASSPLPITKLPQASAPINNPQLAAFSATLRTMKRLFFRPTG